MRIYISAHRHVAMQIDMYVWYYIDMYFIYVCVLYMGMKYILIQNIFMSWNLLLPTVQANAGFLLSTLN